MDTVFFSTAGLIDSFSYVISYSMLLLSFAMLQYTYSKKNHHKYILLCRFDATSSSIVKGGTESLEQIFLFSNNQIIHYYQKKSVTCCLLMP